MGNKSMTFPVLSLNRNITNNLMEMAGPFINENLLNGLQNRVRLIDLNSAITVPAEIISPDVLDRDTGEVILSAAFCQYVWFLCDIVLKIMDRRILIDGANAVNTYLNKFIKNSLKTFRTQSSFPGIKNYYECVEGFGKTRFKDAIKKEAVLCEKLVSKARTLSMRPFQEIKPKGKYEERVNSVYCFAMALILLHERGHYDLGHLKINKIERAHENEADQSAIWTALVYEAKNKRFSMITGILFGFYSILMLNPLLKSDAVHPDEFQRLSSFHNLVKDEYFKYSQLYSVMMEIWEAYCDNIKKGRGLKETFELFL